MRQALGQRPSYFQLKGFQVTCQRQANGDGSHQLNPSATIKVAVEEQDILAAADGNGPVAALGCRPAKSITELLIRTMASFYLADYKVRIIVQWGWHRRKKPEF